MLLFEIILYSVFSKALMKHLQWTNRGGLFCTFRFNPYQPETMHLIIVYIRMSWSIIYSTNLLVEIVIIITLFISNVIKTYFQFRIKVKILEIMFFVQSKCLYLGIPVTFHSFLFISNRSHLHQLEQQNSPSIQWWIIIRGRRWGRRLMIILREALILVYHLKGLHTQNEYSHRKPLNLHHDWN